MAVPRFLVNALPASGIVSLDAGESNHASSVLRLKPGTPVTLFDGQGGEATGIVERTSKRETQVAIQKRTDTDRELAVDVECLVALPKGDRQRTLVEGLTQLGVVRLVPLITERGVAQPTENAIERLRRTVVDASKQCGRNRLMEVSRATSIPQLIDDGIPDDGNSDDGVPDDSRRWVAHPYGPGAVPLHQTFVPHDTKRVRLAVGPEGGFSEAEICQLKDCGWQQVALGPRILRVEMATLLLAARFSVQPPEPCPSSIKTPYRK